MNKKFTVYSILVILALVLTACQTASASTATTSSRTSTTRQAPQGTRQAPQGTPPAGFNPPQGAAATATTEPTLKPTATATATAAPLSALAEASAKAYFSALEKKDFTAASELVSVYSLTFAEMTRSDTASQLGEQSLAGAAWSDFQVVGSQVFSGSVILVHVTYRTSTTATATSTASSGTGASQTPAVTADAALKDELWPFRLENGQWLYNWNNLIDYKTVDVDSQTQYHITIKPTMLVRYSDRFELHFLMQNQTSDTVYFIRPNDSLAVFHFGDQTAEADKSSKVVISGLRTSFDETIVVKGLFTSYPDYVEIRKAKGYVPNPWYTFQF